MSNPTISATDPLLSIQTASLWSSGDNNTFSGSGGPQAFDPFTGQFADVVNSAGLDQTPFGDQVWDIKAGDEITFVIAVQNRAAVGQAFNIKLRDTMPQGFVIPAAGTGLGVISGSGNPVTVSGDLFDPAGGLTIQDSLPAYDPASGANVDLITFDLQADATLPVPAARLLNTAAIVGYAGAAGGSNLSGEADPTTLAATAEVNTAGYTVAVTPERPLVALQSSQTAAYDVTVTLPLGETRDLRIDELLPHNGHSWLQLAATEILRVGSGIAADKLIAVQPDGSVALGDVIASATPQDPAGDSIALRVTVRGAGTAAGQGTLDVSVSSADPNAPTSRSASTVDTVLPLAAPDVTPTIANTSANQNATDTAIVMPFAKLTLTDPDVGQTETLTIHLSDTLLGSLSTGQGTYQAATGNYTVTGSIDAVQAAARSLTFTTGAGHSGTEQFGLTLDDGAGGVATDASTNLTVIAPSATAAAIAHFPVSSAGTVLTSTATGSQTVASAETYKGPVDYLQYQFIYDGTQPVAMAAQAPNMFIKNVAGSAAVKLLSGQNVVDAGHGSNFLIGGSGQDVFYLDARQLEPTWDTIVGFHSGDIATIWGFQDGVSRYSWEDNAGAAGYAGRTLRLDVAGTGQAQESLTFAGTAAADTAHYQISVGTIGTANYMAVFAL